MATAAPPTRAVPPRFDRRRKYTLLQSTLTSSVTYTAGPSLSVPGNGDANQAVKKSRKHLLLFGILAVSVTYQAGLTPPGSFWQGRASGAHHDRSDDFLHERMLVFFCCNASAFVLSLAIVIMILLRGVFGGARGTKYMGRALSAALILDLFSLIGAYIAGTSLRLFTRIVYVVGGEWLPCKSVPIYYSYMFLVWVSLCVLFQLAVLLAGARWLEAFREKM